jgi:hypothetical protein
MTQTLDVTGLHPDAIALLEEHIRQLRESYADAADDLNNAFAVEYESLDHLSLAERAARLEEYFESLEKSDVVIADHSRRAMPLYNRGIE